jgi:hypothetical protein
MKLKYVTLESRKTKQSAIISVPDLNGLEQVDSKLRLM